MARVSLEELNSAGEPAFVAALADIFERTPAIAQSAFGKRPFSTINALYGAMSDAVRTLSAEKKLDLIRAHPDLAGKAARAGDLTAHSKAEQAGFGLSRLSDRQFETFERLNGAYHNQFGFPFVICVRRHTQSSILSQFERRLRNQQTDEVETAIAEICRIAALRLDETVEAPDRLKVHGQLSTHVLDTFSGRPAAGVAVSLVELSGEGQEQPLARAVTNKAGRTDRALVADRPVPIGRYELRFDVAEYYSRIGAPLADPPFLDVVPIRFSVAEPEGHYHVPLLITPWSYSTYRGS